MHRAARNRRRSALRGQVPRTALRAAIGAQRAGLLMQRAKVAVARSERHVACGVDDFRLARAVAIGPRGGLESRVFTFMRHVSQKYGL